MIWECKYLLLSYSHSPFHWPWAWSSQTLLPSGHLLHLFCSWLFLVGSDPLCLLSFRNHSKALLLITEFFHFPATSRIYSFSFFSLFSFFVFLWEIELKWWWIYELSHSSSFNFNSKINNSFFRHVWGNNGLQMIPLGFRNILIAFLPFPLPPLGCLHSLTC